MSEEKFCYAGMCACGCGAVRAVSLDDPDQRAETSEFVAELIMDGLAVERMPATEGAARMGACKRQGQLPL